MAKRKHVDPAKKKTGKPSAWLKVKDRLEEIADLVANGATLDQIAKHVGIRESTLYQLKSEYTEFADALTRARARQETRLVGKLWQLGMEGATESGEDYTDENGVRHWKRHSSTPQLPAIHILLKQHHGWSDNPVKDNAEANALNDAQLRAAFCARLGLASYCNTPVQVQVPPQTPAKPDKPDANRPA